MNKQVLMMKYHPAKKEIEFHRFQNGREIPIRSDSVLRTNYMNMKGKFILQDHGNEFFDDIAVAFDGLEDVDIEVITTRMDYEDFVQMVLDDASNERKFDFTEFLKIFAVIREIIAL